MRRLNMTRDAFASRIGVSRRALDTWLLPDESPESRAMPEIAARYVGEILGGLPEGGPYTQSAHLTIDFEGRPQLLSIDQFSRDSAEALFRTADMMQPIARRKKI